MELTEKCLLLLTLFLFPFTLAFDVFALLCSVMLILNENLILKPQTNTNCLRVGLLESHFLDLPSSEWDETLTTLLTNKCSMWGKACKSLVWFLFFQVISVKKHTHTHAHSLSDSFPNNLLLFCAHYWFSHKQTSPLWQICDCDPGRNL